MGLLSLTAVFSQTEKEKVLETVNKSAIEGHIYFLADDLLKGRETGTDENKIAASYLANTLRSYGVKPNPKTGTYYQKFELRKIEPSTKRTLFVNKVRYTDIVAVEPIGISFKGDGVFVGHGLAEDYLNIDVQGKMVIMKAGSSETKDTRAAFKMRSQKLALATEAGAKGVIEFVNADATMWDFIDHNFTAPRLETIPTATQANAENAKASDKEAGEQTLPYVWVRNTDEQYTNKMKKNQSVITQLTLGTVRNQKVKTQNVIGIIEGTDPKLKNEYIIYSAHYDHVGIGTPDETGDVIYNGARDNAIGTTTVLSMAQNLAKYPTKRSALFILFTGEEKGLLGSEYYVENPVLPLNQMVFCFNSDNGGYNDTSLATIIGLPRTTAAQNIKDGVSAFGLKAIDDPAPEQGLFDRSDNVHFAAKGIPAPTFSLGFTAFNGDVTKYYHRPGDHADSLDYDYLEKFFRSYVMTGRLIGNDDTTPVWTKGDKYEAAGQKLYKN